MRRRAPPLGQLGLLVALEGPAGPRGELQVPQELYAAGPLAPAGLEGAGLEGAGLDQQ